MDELREALAAAESAGDVTAIAAIQGTMDEAQRKLEDAEQDSLTTFLGFL